MLIVVEKRQGNLVTVSCSGMFFLNQTSRSKKKPCVKLPCKSYSDFNMIRDKCQRDTLPSIPLSCYHTTTASALMCIKWCELCWQEPVCLQMKNTSNSSSVLCRQSLGGNEPREQISPLAGAHQHIGTFVIGGIDWPYKLWIYTRS